MLSGWNLLPSNPLAKLDVFPENAILTHYSLIIFKRIPLHISYIPQQMTIKHAKTLKQLKMFVIFMYNLTLLTLIYVIIPIK